MTRNFKCHRKGCPSAPTHHYLSKRENPLKKCHYHFCEVHFSEPSHKNYNFVALEICPNKKVAYERKAVVSDEKTEVVTDGA